MVCVTQMTDDKKEQLIECEKSAERKVKQIASFIVEPALSKELSSLIRDNTIGNCLAAGDDYVLMYLDTNLLGESTSQPWRREMAVRSAAVKQLMGAVLRARGNDTELHGNDLWIIAGGMSKQNDSIFIGGSNRRKGSSFRRQRKRSV